MATTALVKKEADSVRTFLEQPEQKAQLNRALPKHITTDKLLRTTMTALLANPALLECDRASLFQAIMQLAQFGLTLDLQLGQAYLVPFKKKVVLIPGYRGYLQLMRNSKELKGTPTLQVVYENDFLELVYGTNKHLAHSPAMGEKGKIIGAYCYLDYKDGSSSFDFMAIDELEKIRLQHSQQPEGKAWRESTEEMYKKTVFRRHAKVAPVSIEIQSLAHLDEQAYLGQDQFVALPETPATVTVPSEPDEAPQKGYDELIAEKKLNKNEMKSVEQFVASIAEGNKVGEDEIKASASERFGDFWKAFEKWVVDQKGKQDPGPEETLEQAPPLDEEPPLVGEEPVKENPIPTGPNEEGFLFCPHKQKADGKQQEIHIKYCDNMCDLRKKKECSVFKPSEQKELPTGG